MAEKTSSLQGDLASRDQRRAADPRASVWVGASAGTGKTKVLTDRLLRLLLEGARPERLLCLTFTKAAAAEMANRLAEQLARWASCSEAELEDSLFVLCGKQPSFEQQVRARRLFARVLETPGGMRIQTIHAFCQSLLRRFPLEAGLAPHFSAIDERDAAELMDAARETVFQRAAIGADPALSDALGLICDSLHETLLPKFLNAIASHRARLHRMIEAQGGLDGVLRALSDHLDVSADETAETVLAAACRDQVFAVEKCRWAAQALLGSKKDTDVDRGRIMADWLEKDEVTRTETFRLYLGAFLTEKKSTYFIRDRLYTKQCGIDNPGLADILYAEAERMVRLDDRMRAVQLRRASEALLRFAAAWLSVYQSMKQNRAQLDFEDLIQAARRLLNGSPGRAAWVLYKLDGGIEHILIDEAQDTSPDQWAIVRALSDEFFTGLGAVEVERTVFAVGDPKQSIYSFQGADPRAFDETRTYLHERVTAAEKVWETVPLQVSFRSSPAVLEAVNATFSALPGRDGVLAEGEEIHHISWRHEDSGRVEVWPLVKPRSVDDPPPWKPPVEAVQGDNSRLRLARLVAERIRVMTSGEILASKGRPIRPSDILVLVRTRRNGFVDDLVRELKSRAVPVAGNDRMVLTEQMAVMDLMALGNFLLLPEDDLTLAVVLRSPLIGLAEDELFTLAYRRAATLWDSLRAAAGAAPFDAAYKMLSDLLNRADASPPHDLFSRILVDLGGRRKIIARLGTEAEDPLDEFMGLTLAFEQVHAPSLQGFLHWMESGAVEIKRNLEQAKSEKDAGSVRIMTVHGSKGLQAPIVFLPDTVGMPGTGNDMLLWLEEEGGDCLLWPPRAELRTTICREVIEQKKALTLQEYRRLLYVAMTRAEDRLYVAGWQNGSRAPSEGNWYDTIRTALVAHPDSEEIDDAFLKGRPAEADESQVLVLSSPQKRSVDAHQAQAEETSLLPLPAWVSSRPPAEPSPPRPLVPSRPDDEEPPVRSPLVAEESGSHFQRGIIVHKLLQVLPDLLEIERVAAARRLLSRPLWGMTERQGTELIHEVMAVLSHPEFAPIFGAKARSEVPIVGLLDDRVLTGQVDRLLVEEKDVWVIDYKTNRYPPASAQDVPVLYVRQMAAYYQALRHIYPEKSVHCALLWTDGPTLMPLETTLLEQAFLDV